MSTVNRLCRIVTFVLATPLASLLAQQPSAAELAKPVPVDPMFVTGTLPNGLRYFIRENRFPAKRAELRLVVKVGSVNEADDQLGLAHFLEHMAFNGTTHFPKQELVSYLQSVGMRFGADVNAYTGFDETVYMLQLPTDKPEIMQKGIEILGDWAHQQALDSTQIDAERGVVIEEWRLRRGAGARMQDKQFPVLLKDSRYATRLPIGNPELLRTFKHDAVRRFYRDWYRPDVMSVIVVGDFDKAEMERLVKARFGGIPKAATPTKVPVHALPTHADTYVTIATDREATNSSVTMYALVPTRNHLTFGGYRDRTVERVYFAMLNARLGEIAQKPNAPFVGAGLSRSYFLRTADAYTLGASVRDGGLVAGLEAVLTELERANRHGFAASELERARTNAIAGTQRSFAVREQRTSASRADEVVRHVVNAEDAAGTEIEHEMQMRILPAVTLAEVNAMAHTRPPTANRVIVASAPDKAGVSVPTEAQLLAVVSAVKSKTLEPYTDVVVNAPLMARLPTPGSVVSESTIPEIGVTEWRLSNGARVVLKPTNFQTDQIVLSGMSPGGSSLVPDSMFVNATFATTTAGIGGLGEFSQNDLRKVLTGKTASAGASIGARSEAVSGNASRKDLETMFQLVHLRFTAVRRDTSAFAAFLQANQAMLANRAVSPMSAFTDTISATMSQNHPRARPITAKTFDEISLDRSLAIYRDRFADASDFTFLIVGDFAIDSMKPHVERYLASLPSLGRKEAGRDVGIRPPTGVIKKVVRAGTEPQSQTMLTFSGPFQYDPVGRYLLSSMGEILQNRLLEKLREALGGTYSVSASANGGREAPATYSATVSFGSAPERADELAKAVMAEITALQTQGPSTAEVDKVKEAQRRSRELAVKQNAFWLGNLGSAYQYGDDPRDILKQEDRMKALTPEAIRDIARKYLDMSNYVHVTLLPVQPKG